MLPRDKIPEDQVTDRLVRANAIAAGALGHAVVRPNVLCRQCQKCIELLKPRWKGKDMWDVKRRDMQHHPSIPELIASASSGCHLCATFAGGEFRLRLATVDVAKSTYRFGIEDHGEYALVNLTPDEESSNPKPALSDLLGVYQKRKYPYLPLASSRTDSDSTFDIIQQWISSCMKNTSAAPSQE
jgi:hypothetical protein